MKKLETNLDETLVSIYNYFANIYQSSKVKWSWGMWR
jgi:hypothetical protein